MNFYFITLCTIAIALVAQARPDGIIPDVGSLVAMPESMTEGLVPTNLLDGQAADTDGNEETEETDEDDDPNDLSKRGLLSSGNDGAHKQGLLDLKLSQDSDKQSHKEESQNEGLLDGLLKRGLLSSTVPAPAGELLNSLPLGGMSGFVKVRRSDQQ